ncbi:MAG: MBL fold metallo-hydrolase [Thaumarchaeota archaeon]|nr:MBL fold metallo-hydrolase [Nitrososphaerota archaeon]
MRVEQIPVGPMQNFSYLVWDEGTGEGVAIDSGWEVESILEAAKRANVKVKYAIATHRHFDHAKTIRELADSLGAKVVAHERSEVPADVRVKDGEVLEVGGARVKVIYTPGHTEDSICLVEGKNLFTGDTLFIGNCGRTDLPGGSPEKLFHSLQDVILSLPGDLMVYPGHDYGEVKHRRLGEERKTNPTLLAKTLREFTGVG